jgi:hypothetical protein
MTRAQAVAILRSYFVAVAETHDDAAFQTCFPFHEPAKGRDFVITHIEALLSG